MFANWDFRYGLVSSSTPASRRPCLDSVGRQGDRSIARPEKKAGHERLSEMLDQQLGEDPDFSRGVLSWRPDDEYAGRGDRKACHHRDQGAGSQVALDEAIRKPGDAKPRYGGGGESGAVVRLEPPLRMNGDRLF